MNYPENYRNEMSQQDFSLLQIGFINKVYATMTLGLLVTAVTAWMTYQSVSPNTLASMLFPCAIGEIALVFVLSWAATRLPAILAFLGFLGYAILNGLTLSIIFYGYQIGSIWQVFLTTSLSFGLMSVYGVVTKRDLTSLGNLLFMVLIGMIVASLLNLFFRSTGMDLVLSLLGVVVFAGLTAYDTQKLKALHESGFNHGGIAVLGALSLYLDFMNMFLYLLRLLGRKK